VISQIQTATFTAIRVTVTNGNVRVGTLSLIGSTKLPVYGVTTAAMPGRDRTGSGAERLFETGLGKQVA
jgi:hypothetical protein